MRPSENEGVRANEDAEQLRIADYSEDQEQLFARAPVSLRRRVLPGSLMATYPPDPREQSKPIQEEGQSHEKQQDYAAIDSNVNNFSRHCDYLQRPVQPLVPLHRDAA